MNYLKKILKTKKVQKIKEQAESLTKIAKNKIIKISKELKQKSTGLDKKYHLSEKGKKVFEAVEEKIEKVGDKIEAVLDEKISFDDFSKVEIKLGKILEAEKVKKSKKLLKLKVDFGNEDVRQIISGISEYYQPEDIIGKKTVFVTNLEPRNIMGLKSEGMILGLSDQKNFSILVPKSKKIKEGSRAS